MVKRLFCAISLLLMFCIVDGITFQLGSASKHKSVIFATYPKEVVKGDFYRKPDIGTELYQVVPFHYYSYTFPAGNDRNGIKWMSFPSLDRLYGHEALAYTFFDPILIEGICDRILWKVRNNSIESIIYSGFALCGPNHEILPQQGYKIQMNTGLQNPITITTPAIKPIPRYQTWNMETQEYEAQSLSLKERKPYYMLKLDTASINDTPVPKLYMGSFPNPFNPETTLRFSLPEAAEITLDIYNVKGQKVCNVASGSYNGGTHACNWNAKDSSGKRVASGLYFAILSYQDKQISRKLMLMK